jgi:hypothetical protein
MAKDYQKYYDQIADDLESYLKMMKRYFIIKHLSRKQYKKDVKTVKKAIRKLRNGNADEVLNMQRFKAYINQL